MMSTAPTKGAHVMMERIGHPFMTFGGGLRPPSEPPPKAGLRRQSRRSNAEHSCVGRPGSSGPLAPHHEKQDADRDGVDVVLRYARLDTAQLVSELERPRAL